MNVTVGQGADQGVFAAPWGGNAAGRGERPAPPVSLNLAALSVHRTSATSR